MTVALVLLEVMPDGALAASSAGLLAAAGRVGEPVAVIVGPPRAAEEAPVSARCACSPLTPIPTP